MFKKSSFSPWTPNPVDVFCVEVGFGKNFVIVKDSKDPTGQVLTFNNPEWDAFIKGVKNGEFDLR